MKAISYAIGFILALLLASSIYSCKKETLTPNTPPPSIALRTLQLQFSIAGTGDNIEGYYSVNGHDYSINPCTFDTVTIQAYTGQTIFADIVAPHYSIGDKLSIRFYEMFTVYNTVATNSGDTNEVKLTYVVK